MARPDRPVPRRRAPAAPSGDGARGVAFAPLARRRRSLAQAREHPADRLLQSPRRPQQAPVYERGGAVPRDRNRLEPATGAAVAFGLSRLGARGTIFVPHGADGSKVEKIRQLGGTVEFHGDDSAETERPARSFAAEGTNQDAVLKHFSKKLMKPDEFFSKVFKKDKGDELLQDQIEAYMEKRRATVLEKMRGKTLFEMGNDGEPTWRRLEVLEKRASIQFHFMRSDENTNYYPTITYDGKKIDIPSPLAYLVCKNPAWMVVNGKLCGFDKHVDGKKLLPFLSKKFVVIPKNLEETYYNRFVAPLIASFDDVEVQGFEINKNTYEPHPLLTISELPPANAKECAGAV